MRSLNPFALEETKKPRRSKNGALSTGAVVGIVAVVAAGTGALLYFRPFASGKEEKSMVDKALSIARSKMPESEIASLSEGGQATYLDIGGLNLSSSFQVKSLDVLEQALDGGLDPLNAALKAGAELLPGTKLSEYYRMAKARLGPVTVELSSKLQQIWTELYKLATILEVVGNDPIAIDADPFGAGDQTGTCAAIVPLLKDGVLTNSGGKYSTTRPTKSDPNVTLRQTYGIPVEDMKKYLGAMALRHEFQIEAFDILLDGWRQSYMAGVPPLGLVTETAEAVAPNCIWLERDDYTPDMKIMWADLKRLSALAEATVMREEAGA